jgi:hypothetical protein
LQRVTPERQGSNHTLRNSESPAMLGSMASLTGSRDNLFHSVR